MRVYTYKRDPSGKTKCIVSACKRAPGWVTSGLGVASCGRFHGLFFLRRLQRSSTRLTDDNETMTRRSLSAWCTCSAQRRRPTRSRIIALTTSRDSVRGLVFGREERVGIAPYPQSLARFDHFTMTLWLYPLHRATFLVLRPFLKSSTASPRTFGILGFVVYAKYGLNITPK